MNTKLQFCSFSFETQEKIAAKNLQKNKEGEKRVQKRGRERVFSLLIHLIKVLKEDERERGNPKVHLSRKKSVPESREIELIKWIVKPSKIQRGLDFEIDKKNRKRERERERRFWNNS